MSDGPPINDYLARQRALARKRQRECRERKKQGHVTVTPRLHDEPGWWNGAKLNELRVAQNLAAGMSNEKALITAGQSRNATILIEKGKERLAQVLKEKALTIETVVNSTVESIEATSPMLTAAGSIERPDWTARAAGRRDAIALLDRAGELPSTQAGSGGVQITVNVLRFDQHIQDVVARQDDSIAITSESNEIAP